MKIIRFITPQGTKVMGCDWDGQTASLVEQSEDKSFSNTGERVDVVKILPPVETPAIICIGLNYRRHAQETGQEIPKYPAVFMKYPGSLAGHKDAIVIPECASDPPEVDYEAELGVIIKTAAKNVPEDKALDYVLGYTCTNDISARRWQKHAGAFQWTRGKSYDTFCPCGPVMTTADEITDPQNLAIKCRLNGEVMQDSHTSDMVFSIANMISYLSQSSTLLPGTLILTGTPEGVGFTRKPRLYLAPGDRMEVEIEGIGVLENPVEKER